MQLGDEDGTCESSCPDGDLIYEDYETNSCNECEDGQYLLPNPSISMHCGDCEANC